MSETDAPMSDRPSESVVTLKDLFAMVRPKDHAETGEAPASSSGLDDLLSVEVKDAKIDPTVMLDGILEQVGSLLDIEVPTLIASVWSKATQLQEYRDQARHPPEESVSVEMAEHTVQSRYHPSIELLINGKSVDSLEIDVGREARDRRTHTRDPKRAHHGDPARPVHGERGG